MQLQTLIKFSFLHFRLLHDQTIFHPRTEAPPRPPRPFRSCPPRSIPSYTARLVPSCPARSGISAGLRQPSTAMHGTNQQRRCKKRGFLAPTLSQTGQNTPKSGASGRETAQTRPNASGTAIFAEIPTGLWRKQHIFVLTSCIS